MVKSEIKLYLIYSFKLFIEIYGDFFFFYTNGKNIEIQLQSYNLRILVMGN